MKKTLLATAIALTLGLSAQSWASRGLSANDDVDANNGGAAANDSSLAIAKTDNSRTDNSKRADIDVTKTDNSLYDSQNDNSKRADIDVTKDSYNDNSKRADIDVTKDSYNDNSKHVDVTKDSYNDSSKHVDVIKDSYNDNSKHVDIDVNQAIATTDLDGTVSYNSVQNGGGFASDSSHRRGHGHSKNRGTPANMTASNNIDNAFNGAAGITQVAQNAGNMGLVQQGATVQANLSLGSSR